MGKLKLKHFKPGYLTLCSAIVLAGCGGSSSDNKEVVPEATPPAATAFLNAHYFTGRTNTSGSELWKSDGTTDGTSMVKEINPIGHSNSANFTEMGETVFFTATDAVHGNELWKSDVNGVNLVKDIYPGSSSNPQNLTVLNGKLYFTAESDTASSELWESDGTETGTVRVGTFTYVNQLTVMADNTLYFMDSSRLWHFDGVTATEIAVTGMWSPNLLTAVGSRLYFVATTLAEGSELWTSDGTIAGTHLVKDMLAGNGSFFGSYNQLMATNGRLVFTDNVYINTNLYVSDGTEVGTVQLMTNDTVPAPVQAYYYRYLSQAGTSHVYFTAPSAQSYTLWRTDGTPAGTMEVSNVINNVLSEAKQAVNNQTILKTDKGLFSTDGTPAGTSLITSQNVSFATMGNSVIYTVGLNVYMSDGINPGVLVTTLNSYVYSLYSGATKVYFSYNSDDGSGQEPWVTDGTAVGTTKLFEVNPNPSSSADPYATIVFNNTLYFIANDGYSDGLWKTDGTDAGTVKISPADVYNFNYLTVSGDKFYFTAEDEAHGEELWVSDGTAAGTKLFLEFNPGSYDSYLQGLKDVNGVLYIVDGSNDFMWKTTGTADSLSLVSFTTPYRNDMFSAGDKLYFTGPGNSGEDTELWVSDGTVSGTHLLKDINPSGDGIYSNTQNAVALGDMLYFIANDGANGWELWKTDGTEAGTVMVINLNAADDGVYYRNTALITWGTNLYFTAYSSDSYTELWKTDGTEAGTVQVTNLGLNDGEVNISGNDSAIMDNHLYFTANNGNDGDELWKTDGTTAGTVMVMDINSTGDSYPYGYNVFNNTLFFIAYDEEHGNELWKSDGTAAGTVLVKDVYTGTVDGSTCVLNGCWDYFFEY